MGSWLAGEPGAAGAGHSLSARPCPTASEDIRSLWGQAKVSWDVSLDQGLEWAWLCDTAETDSGQGMRVRTSV